MTSAETKALSLAAVFLTGLAVWMAWKWAGRPETLVEDDVMRALNDPLREKVQAKRVGASKPFWRRAERRALGLLTLGEAKRRKEAA